MANDIIFAQQKQDGSLVMTLFIIINILLVYTYIKAEKESYGLNITLILLLVRLSVASTIPHHYN